MHGLSMAGAGRVGSVLLPKANLMLYIAPLKIKAPLKIIQETCLPGQLAWANEPKGKFVACLRSPLKY